MPVVLYSERADDGAIVYMRIEEVDRVGDELLRRGPLLLLALPVVRQAGEWRVDDATWLRVEVENYEQLDRLREASGRGKKDAP